MTDAASLSHIGLNGFAPYLMNRIMGRYNADLRARIAELGLTTPKMRALAILTVHDGLPIGELAIFAVVEQSTLSRALDGLEQDGLIRRATDAQDQRSSRIHLTQQGAATAARLWPDMQGAEARMFDGIETAEKEAFLGTLRKMLTNIRVHDI